jgi:hypothetical protein
MSPPTATKLVNPALRLLNALKAGSKPIMTFLGLPSFRTAQMVAQTGLDVRLQSPSLTTNSRRRNNHSPPQFPGDNHRLRTRPHKRRRHTQRNSRHRLHGSLASGSNPNDTPRSDQTSPGRRRPVSFQQIKAPNNHTQDFQNSLLHSPKRSPHPPNQHPRRSQVNRPQHQIPTTGFARPRLSLSRDSPWRGFADVYQDCERDDHHVFADRVEGGG